MELKQLQYFITCADAKSFSKAALNLYTSQSNISKTIAALENEVGHKLFQRKQYGIELTERGKHIYKYAKSMLEMSDKILSDTEIEFERELRVSFQPCSWFAEAFCQYYLNEENQNTRYNIISASVDEVISRISNNKDQLGFVYLDAAQLSKLEDPFMANHIGHIEINKTRNVLYLGKMTRDLSISELRLIQDWGESRSDTTPWKNVNMGEETGRDPRVIVNTNSDLILREMLEKTELCNVGPLYCENGMDLTRGEAVDFSNNKQEIFYVCIFKNDRPMESIPKKFLSFIRDFSKKRNLV